jgi:uncharacterized iron-regulated membrane protein
MTTLTVGPEVAAESAASGLYRRIWRWHFYAGLICLPFVVLLATTGALYLFRQEIEDVVYRDLFLTQASGQLAQEAPEQLASAALKAHAGRLVRYTPPKESGRTAEFDIVQASDGDELQVFVDPANGHVLGSVPAHLRLMPLVRSLHSLTLLGTVANHVVEIVAGWVLVLLSTGVYLWWPRGRSGGVVTVRGKPSGRLWWRDLHAVCGVFAALVIGFLALTGMPWSAFWGHQFNAWITDHGMGVPAAAWNEVPKSVSTTAPTTLRQTAGSTAVGHEHHHTEGAPMSEAGEVPWIFRETSRPHSAQVSSGRMIGLDKAVRRLAGMGLVRGYQLSLPADPTGVYTAIYLPDKAAGQRVVHLDAYSGQPLADVGYAQYGKVSKVTEWGVSVHMGREFGRANQLLMLAGCLALILLAVSSAVMWWKRRPRGTLAAPPAKQADRIARGVVVIAVALGVFFPLLGASMLLALLIDLAMPRLWRERWAL